MKKKVFVIFLQYDENVHRYKDPGIIAQLLSETHDVKILSAQSNPNPLCIKMQEDEIYQGSWMPKDQPCTLLIFHGGKPYYDLICKAKKMGHKVIIKADTDGHLVRKIWNPFSDEMYSILRSNSIELKPLFKHWLRLMNLPQWARKRGLYEVDYIVLESMKAYNIFLSAFPDLADKLVMLPNGAFFEKNNQRSSSKCNQVIAVGRWDDYNQKNPELLFKAINIVGKERNDWNFVVIGKYDNYVQALYEHLDTEVKNRTQLIGAIESDKVLEYMEKSKVLINTSRWESFGLVGIEALSKGCSIVCTPTAMSMQTADGLLGTCATSFNPHELAQAALLEINFWELNIRSSEEIINTVKNFYDWKSIVKKITTFL